MYDSPKSQLRESSSSTQATSTVNSQREAKDDRITRLECMMEKMMQYLENFGQESARSIRDNAIIKTGKSCIQVYHSFKNNCSNRWVIPLEQIGKCGNDVQGIQLTPFVSAGLITTEPQPERQHTRSDEIPGRSRRPSAVGSSLSVPAILFPSCARREDKRHVRYPRSQRQTHNTNLSSQGSRNGESGTSQGSWKPESDASSLLLEKESPNPSGTKPTFVAMIKTAIRDLRRYKRTSVEAISKYILLRYQVQNDILLQYLLDWMTDMDILERKEHNYVFSKKRLVKKTTVAVIKNRKRSRSSRRRRKSKRSSKYKSRSKSRRTKRSRDAYGVNCGQKKRRRRSRKRRQTCAYEFEDYNEPPKRKCRKTKSKKQSKRRKKSKPRKPCTCRHELRAAKNRVKVKSRYVRRGGKIYKEEEYI